MRKTLLLLLTLAFAIAASGQRVSMNPRLSSEPVKGKYEFRSTHKSTQRDGKAATVQSRKAPARVDVITEQPEGELKIYERSGGAIYNYWGYVFSTYQDGTALQIVFAPDGKTVYLQDIISQAHTGTWVRAELSDDGKTITMPLGQHLAYFDEMGYGLITAWVDITVDEDGYIQASTNDAIQEVTFTLDDDGTISLNGSSGDVDNFECSGVGLIYDDDFTWAGYADWESVYTPFTGAPVALPEDAVLEDFSMQYTNSEGSHMGKMVKLAVVGEDYYVQGFSDAVPSGVMKGTKTNDKVVFPSNQYLGVANGYFLNMAALDDEGYLLEDLVFDYLEKDGVDPMMELRTDNVLGVVAGFEAQEMYYKPVLEPYFDHAATPANPEVIDFNDEGEIGGYNMGQFSVPTIDTEGNFISPNDLYYRIYFDEDELFTFGPDEYPYVKEFMTDVPYNYTEAYDITKGGSYIYFYETGFQRVGIQSVFRGGGEEHMSEIVYMDIKEPAAPVGKADFYAGYCDDKFEAAGFSAGRAQGYDLAMFVYDPSLKGMKVKGLRISAPATGITQYTGWLSNSLALEMKDGVKVAKSDIASNVGNVADGHAEVLFDEPYEIGENGFFAGYTIPVTVEERPMMITSDDMGGGFWLHTTAAYRDWVDMSSMGSPCIELILEGQEVNAATIIVPANTYAKKNEPIYVNAKIYNHGRASLSSFSYTYEINGVTKEASLKTGISADHWGRSRDLMLELDPIAEAGIYPLTVTVTRANNGSNKDVEPTHTGMVNIMDMVPVHRVLVEEYTGTWCGWCTRGLVAMQKLAEIFGDDFIGVAYHNGDPMEIMTEYPSNVQGFPGAFVERYHDVDPYYGYEFYGFGMKDLVELVMGQLAVVDLNVKAEWADDDKTEIKAKVESNFVMNAPGSDYGIEVMLVEDDMYGPAGTDWDQHNYYATMGDQYGDDPDLGPLCDLPSTIEGYHFNDVLVATSGVIDESLPESIIANTTNNFEYTFYVDYVYNTSFEPLIQDKDKLHVVAIVVEKATSKVLNAAKAHYIGDASVYELSDTEKVVDSTIYYDLMGRMVSNPSTGIYVKVVRYTDGSQRSFKVLKK